MDGGFNAFFFGFADGEVPLREGGRGGGLGLGRGREGGRGEERVRKFVGNKKTLTFESLVFP